VVQNTVYNVPSVYTALGFRSFSTELVLFFVKFQGRSDLLRLKLKTHPLKNC